MGASLKTGLPAADEKTITSLSGALAIKPNYAVDKVGGTIGNSVTETVIAQVQIPANSTISHLIIMAGARSRGAIGSGGEIKIRVGTVGDITDTQVGNATSAVEGNVSFSVIGSPIFSVAISPADYDKTVLNYVSITGKNSTANANYYCICDSLVVIGV